VNALYPGSSEVKGSLDTPPPTYTAAQRHKVSQKNARLLPPRQGELRSILLPLGHLLPSREKSCPLTGEPQKFLEGVADVPIAQLLTL